MRKKPLKKGALLTRAKHTIVSMCDNRIPQDTPLHRARYFELAAVVNFSYAKKHGYAFRYYVVHGEHLFGRKGAIVSLDRSAIDRLIDVWEKGVHLATTNDISYKSRKLIYKNLVSPLRRRRDQKDPPTMRGKFKRRQDCRHIQFGYRASPWCKLIGMYEALLEGFERVVYIDSDAIFNSHEMGITGFIGSTEVVSGQPDVATLILTDNFPYRVREANAGFLIWRNGPLAIKMLRTWWNLDAGPYHHQHDFEQYALHKALIDSIEYKQHIAIFRAVTFREREGQFVRHVGSDQSHLREHRFRLSLKRLGICDRKFSRLAGEIRQHHVVVLNAEKSRIHQ